MPEIDESVTDESTESTAEVTDQVTEEAPEAPPADEFKQKWENQRKVNRDLEAKLRALQQEAELKDKSADEQAIELARREAETAAKAKADVRILKSELRAVAAGKLADPADAALYIDLSTFEVDEDGEVDSDALAQAVADLLTRKPHLAAAGQPRFQGGGDGGSRLPAKPDESIDDAIKAAQTARNFALVATLKQQKAAQKG